MHDDDNADTTLPQRCADLVRAVLELPRRAAGRTRRSRSRRGGAEGGRRRRGSPGVLHAEGRPEDPLRWCLVAHLDEPCAFPDVYWCGGISFSPCAGRARRLSSDQVPSAISSAPLPCEVTPCDA